MHESKYVFTLFLVFWHNEIYSIAPEWDTCGLFFLKPKTGIAKWNQLGKVYELPIMLTSAKHEYNFCKSI